jgi:Phage integrase family
LDARAKAGLPPVTFHGLRQGAATMLLAAGQPIKVISEILGHATSAFTADVHTEVAEELAKQAASAIAAYVHRQGRMSHQMSSRWGKRSLKGCRKSLPICKDSQVKWAEARGFEPRTGGKPEPH